MYGSNTSDVPPSEALQDMIQRIGSWVDRAEAKELEESLHPGH